VEQTTEQPFIKLKKYLKNHELDIAIKENDFGELAGIFKYFFGRLPEGKDKWNK